MRSRIEGQDFRLDQSAEARPVVAGLPQYLGVRNGRVQ
jgi:hypothetical protein